MKIPSASTLLQLGAALFLTAPFLSAQMPATGLCDTGRTPQSPQPLGCTTTSLVSPINPLNGGPFTDGNWSLAFPFPSAPYTEGPPDPCTINTLYDSAPVNVPWYTWFNPVDARSQWIEPLGGGATPAGWYIYRTYFDVPAAQNFNSYYRLETEGQLTVDDGVKAIYLENPASDRRSCRVLATFNSLGQESSWTSFHLSATRLIPGTRAFLYFVVDNSYLAFPVDENPTGLRVEFFSPYFLPY